MRRDSTESDGVPLGRRPLLAWSPGALGLGVAGGLIAGLVAIFFGQIDDVLRSAWILIVGILLGAGARAATGIVLSSLAHARYVDTITVAVRALRRDRKAAEATSKSDS